jgi:hypothetical protein
MCQLIVMLRDTDGDQLPQAGDVIDILPDGHVFGGQEIGNPAWRILSVPGAAPRDFGDLLTRPLRTDPDDSSPHRYRANRLDMAALGEAREFTPEALRAAVSPRPDLPSLSIGNPPHVIG